jgi:hypothetical protein
VDLATDFAALTVTYANAVLVLESSSPCVETSASAMGCKLDALDAFKARHGLPPGRLGSDPSGVAIHARHSLRIDG